jgi:hypothetical protein
MDCMRPNAMVKNFITVILAAEAIFNLAWAGPPFITDDPEPVKYQTWEVNYAIYKTWRQGSASANLPTVDINYGASPNVQLHVQPSYSYERTSTDRHWGIDDTQVGVKYRFLNIEQDDSSIMAGIYPMFQMPTGNRGLGPNRGKSQSFIPLWLQRSSEKWTIYGGTGYWINPGIGYKNSVYVGGAALYQVMPSLQLGMEIFHETPDAVDGQSTTGFNLGGIYNLAHEYNWLFSAGRGLVNAAATNQFSVYSALQVLY